MNVVRAFIAIFVLAFAHSAALGFEIGETVVVIHDAELKVETRQVATASAGLRLKISAINGKWLWVSNGRPGWIDSGNVTLLPATTARAEESPIEKHRKKIEGPWEGKPFDLEFSLQDTKPPFVVLQYKEPEKGDVSVYTIRVALKEKVGISWIALEKTAAERLGLPEELFYSFDGHDLVVQAESGRFKGKHRLSRPMKPDSN